MEKLLEEIIEEFHREGVPKLIERKLKIPLDINKAISIIGLRRVGKTFYLYQIAKKLIESGISLKEVFYINFEDERLLEFAPKDFSKIVEIYYKKNPTANKIYFLFDEVQNVDNWEKFVRRLLEKPNFRIFITGSSSKLLSKEIATSLRGRTLSYYLFPFSFKEFLKAKNFEIEKTLIERDRGIVKGLLEEYIKFGGFPEIVDMKSMIT
ncbi:MAG: ATP-binding protein [Methanosarcinales archaeon]